MPVGVEISPSCALLNGDIHAGMDGGGSRTWGKKHNIVAYLPACLPSNDYYMYIHTLMPSIGNGNADNAGIFYV